MFPRDMLEECDPQAPNNLDFGTSTSLSTCVSRIWASLLMKKEMVAILHIVKSWRPYLIKRHSQVFPGTMSVLTKET